MSNETLKNARTRSRRKPYADARLLFVVLGAVLLGFLLWKIGVGNVFEHVRQVGWWALPVLLISLLWKAGNTVAWGLTFPADDRPPFRRLFPIFVGVDAANLLPTANLGSEVTKAYFLRPYTPLSSAASAVVANKTIELLTGGLFAAVGVVIALLSLPGNGQLHTGFGIALLVFAVFITFAFLVQRARPLSRLVRLLRRFGIAPRFLDRRLPAVEQVEENLIAFYSGSHARFFGCAALRLASFVLGLMESFCLVRLMGVDISFTTIYILGAFGFLLRIAFFFMPANLGTFEAGNTYLFYLVGIDPAIGLSTAVLVRARKLFWIGFGPLLLYTLNRMGEGGGDRRTGHVPRPPVSRQSRNEQGVEVVETSRRKG